MAGAVFWPHLGKIRILGAGSYSGSILGSLWAAFWEPFGSFLGHLWHPWGSLGVTWEPFGRTFWEDLPSLDALGLKIVPGLLKVALFSVFLCLLEDL